MINNSPRSAPAASSATSQHTHGALRLTELHRFTDPAEAAASLAIREGDPSGLEFYLDHGRVHVGDVATTTEDAFNAWVSDRAAGLDAIMIAPTRNLVAELNARARAHRLNHTPAASEVPLADGNRASVGDVIITRTQRPPTPPHRHRLGQERRPLDHHPCRQTRRPDSPAQPQPAHRPAARRLCPRLDRSRLRHHHPFRPRRLRRHHARPAHRAGDTAAAVHHAHPRTGRQPPLPSGRRRRRPAHASSGPKPSHPAPRPRPCSRSSPATTRPPQPPRCCENSATRLPGCSRPFSATPTASMSRPSSWLAPRSFRCSTAKPTRSSPNSPASRPGRRSEHTCSLWRLRPVSTHSSTCRQRPPDANYTPPETWPPCWTGASQSPHPPTRGRCPGFPAFRQALHDHPVWGEYLAKRSQLVIGLADQVRDCASQNSEQPVWAPPGSHPTAALLGEVAVWRAAIGVDPQDRRPTGAGQLQAASALWQQNLDRDVALCSHRLRADERKRQIGGPSRDHQRGLDIACPQHALFVGVSRPGPACERQCQLNRFG